MVALSGPLLSLRADPAVAHELPGLLCRSEIIDTQYEEISPLSTAITEIKRGKDLLMTLFAADANRRIE